MKVKSETRILLIKKIKEGLSNLKIEIDKIEKDLDCDDRVVNMGAIYAGIAINLLLTNEKLESKMNQIMKIHADTMNIEHFDIGTLK